MNLKQFESKIKSLADMRKKYKYHVIYDDSVTKINPIKEVINKSESEIKEYKLRDGNKQ